MTDNQSKEDTEFNTVAKPFKIALIIAAMILVVFLNAKVIKSYKPEWFVSVHSETHGEYMGFRIGIDQAGALEVVKSLYIGREQLRFYGQKPIRVANYEKEKYGYEVRFPEDLLDASLWRITYNIGSTAIELKFCSNELIVVTRHKTFF